MSYSNHIGMFPCGAEAAEATSAHEYQRVRDRSAALCGPLEIEDFNLQATPCTSPAKWHLAHTTWFFETFVLRPFTPGYQPWHPLFGKLFNSYYQQIGVPFCRARRGLLSRPTVHEVWQYRAAVDEQMRELLARGQQEDPELVARIELGLHHEQQHQELLLTDLKYNFSINPLQPAYQSCPRDEAPVSMPAGEDWREFAGGLVQIGAPTGAFAFDNERPRHSVYLEPFALAARPVSNGEFLAFIEDAGYHRPELWLADGWDELQREERSAPLYWSQDDAGWRQFTLAGNLPLNLDETACHLSYYEADAYATWAGARLPTEAEWEHAAADQPLVGNFADSDRFHPLAATGKALAQLFGDVWEWTASSYSAYPGFRAANGAIGEYNGKFMSNQMVLRGGSCVSAAAHIRASYRNFFYPGDRWQFSGLRLAHSLRT